MTIVDIHINQLAKIESIQEDFIALKLHEYGLYEGVTLKKIAQAPVHGPILLDINGYKVAIRKKEALAIKVSYAE